MVFDGQNREIFARNVTIIRSRWQSLHFVYFRICTVFSYCLIEYVVQNVCGYYKNKHDIFNNFSKATLLPPKVPGSNNRKEKEPKQTVSKRPGVPTNTCWIIRNKDHSQYNTPV